MFQTLSRLFRSQESNVATKADDTSDRALLERISRTRDEAALEMLIRQHGPMVFSVCRRVLQDHQEAEDAFQATFLVLWHKAGSLRRQGTMAGWLYTVAYRAAVRAKAKLTRQRDLERQVKMMQITQPATDASWREVGELLDEEMNRLPDKYRLPFVLCCLEGMTNEEAAQQLGCPRGTVMSRLSRARERLRDRLAHRGVTLSAAAFTSLLAAHAAEAMPPSLVAATIQSMTFVASGQAFAASAVTPSVILMKGVLTEMFLIKLKKVLLIITIGLAGVGCGTMAYQQWREPGADAAGQAAPSLVARPEKQDVVPPVIPLARVEYDPVKLDGKIDPPREDNPYQERFLAVWKDLHKEKNGYFSPDGLPYHAIETFMIEAPDYGHLTTSEAFSFWIWLEATYGRVTGDWTKLDNAWTLLEKYAIPSAQDQPTSRNYNPSKPATHAGERDAPNQYPVPLEFGVPVGQDTICNELKAAYKTSDIYGMHWLLDLDNWYGYGQRGDGKTRAGFINTFQRGPKESVWHTVPHPSWEAFKWGGRNGFLDLYIRDNNYAPQWRYTNAPDADARLVQAMYWAHQWSKAQKRDDAVQIAKTAKMGDYLRYSLFDKYFKKLGSQGLQSPGGRDDESAHYLISWYYAWGGPIDANQNWAFRIGCSHNHQGYQNPMAAWVLSEQADFKPASANGARDWAKSLERQLEFYRWLQSAEGAIAGGATNSWNGRYDRHPDKASTFYGMAYDWQPVWHDPPSNNWFGFQCWSVERLAELYYLTGNIQAKTILDKWVPWAMKETKLEKDGTYAVPGDLEWSGQPDTWNPAEPAANAKLHVKVTSWGPDIGVTGSYAKVLLYYSAGAKKWAKEDAAAAVLAKELLDRCWKLYRDDKGLSAPEERQDYKRIFEQEIYIPGGWHGKMANGDLIKPGVKFLAIRSRYKDDPDFARVKKAYDRKEAPAFRYHRFWAQVEYATACAVLADLAMAQPKN